MKFIGVFPLLATPIAEARERYASEYYRTPHGACNGKSLGEFAWSSLDGPVEISRINGRETPIFDPWTLRVALDLLDHLFVENVKVGAGYTFFSIDGERLLAESYVASSGNAVVLIHTADETVLYVSSRRHGIPELALRFRDIPERAILMYDSKRTDVRWFESGLEPPVSAQEEEVEHDPSSYGR